MLSLEHDTVAAQVPGFYLKDLANWTGSKAKVAAPVARIQYKWSKTGKSRMRAAITFMLPTNTKRCNPVQEVV